MKKSPPKKNFRRPHTLTPLKLERLRRDFLIKDVAKANGVFTSELSQFETGIRTPSSKTRALLAAFYRVSEETLFPPTEKV